MSVNFYYSFKMDNDEKSITIGVDSSFFTMFFRDSNKMEPEIEPTEYGYHIEFPDLYKEIDLIFDLYKDKIKETIVLKSNSFSDEINIDLKLNTCVVMPEGDCYKVLGEDNTELFYFSDPYYEIPKRSSRYKALSNLVKMAYDKKNTKISYKFNKTSFNGPYPFSIDPSFYFNSSIVRNHGYIRSVLDQDNMMFVTGVHSSDIFIKESEITGSYGYFSDDVVFEKDIRILFPYMNDVFESILVSVEQDNVKKTYGMNTLSEISGKTIKYVDISLPFNGSSNVVLSCLVTLKPSVYGDFQILYVRKFIFLPKVDIGFSSPENLTTSYTKGTDLVFSNSTISVSSMQNFKSSRFYILPYRLQPLDQNVEDYYNKLSDYFAGDNAIAEIPISVENMPIMRSYFKFNPSSLPAIQQRLKISYPRT